MIRARCARCAELVENLQGLFSGLFRFTPSASAFSLPPSPARLHRGVTRCPLKTTPTDEPCFAGFSVAGRETETEQLSTAKTGLARIDFARRRVNRSLDTETLLAVLRGRSPRFFELAEVIGKWVWIQFEQKQPPAVTRTLAELGFHWNYARQSWQHPCGTIVQERASYDPRRRYGSYFAADVVRI